MTIQMPSQDLLEDSNPSVVVTVDDNISQQYVSETSAECGISQDLLQDSMLNDNGMACGPYVQQQQQ